MRLCVAPTGQSSENMTLKAAESLERLGSLGIRGPETEAGEEVVWAQAPGGTRSGELR